jgi:hypothetical protein
MNRYIIVKVKIMPTAAHNKGLDMGNCGHCRDIDELYPG